MSREAEDPSQDRVALPPILPDQLLRMEANALLDAAARLDLAAFSRAVELIESCTGKTVLTGAGTSGLIAGKISATLTSTGTPSAFLHPSDALHGGLGSISEREVVVAVSNSGETGEILALLPYLRHRRVPIVAITGDLGSSLAEASEVVLDAAAKPEACPFNLTPTSSTTVALAIGDALAVTLLQRKGLTPEAFALNHPSGRLGRRLTLRVADLMHAGTRRPAVGPNATWLEVIAAISAGGLGAVTVIHADDGLVGIVTDGDVRRVIQQRSGQELAGLTATAIMTADPVTVGPQALAYDALERMEDRPSQISVLPVVDDEGSCVGILRLHDVVRAGI